VDVRFAELIADPEGTIRMLWTRFGWEVNPDLDQVLAAAGRRHKKLRNKHRYTAEQYGLTAAGIYDEFRYVYDQYDFPAPAETAEA
jgi:hypothetical protein